MKLIVISGRSGSGKTTVLRALEDEGFSCVDNFPVGLLPALVESALREDPEQRMAVCIDARNPVSELKRFPELLVALDRRSLDCEVIYLDALSYALVKRFSETRRRHPLTDAETDLRQAIEAEAGMLSEVADLADLTIDTTQLTGQQLVDLIRTRVVERTGAGLSLLFRSFGFKYGVPVDADFVFDVRCLPNPHWVEDLRPLTGRDPAVQRYLEQEPDVIAMCDDISGFLRTWLAKFEENNRVYVTVAIGCTGGKHRSVYLAEKLGAAFGGLVRHRESPA